MSTSSSGSPTTEPFFADLCAAVAAVAERLDIPFFLVGATARDLILASENRPGDWRRTKDVDFGVRVRTWSEYSKLRQGLIDTGRFAPDTAIQRLLFESALVDLVPFGGVAEFDGQIAWPADPETRLNVLGFEEAYRTADTLQVGSHPVVTLRVVSCTGLVILKFLAWADRRGFATKDAYDLRLLIKNYLGVGNGDRLFSEHRDLVNGPDFDYEIAGARLLGRDMAQQAGPEALAVIRDVLGRDLRDSALAAAATRESGDTESMVSYLSAIREELGQPPVLHSPPPCST
jgi:predicted nucleotidyltransferase